MMNKKEMNEKYEADKRKDSNIELDDLHRRSVQLMSDLFNYTKLSDVSKGQSPAMNDSPWKKYCACMIADYVDRKYGAACGSDAEEIRKDIMEITGMTEAEAKEMEEQADYILFGRKIKNGTI